MNKNFLIATGCAFFFHVLLIGIFFSFPSQQKKLGSWVGGQTGVGGVVTLEFSNFVQNAPNNVGSGSKPDRPDKPVPQDNLIQNKRVGLNSIPTTPSHVCKGTACHQNQSKGDRAVALTKKSGPTPQNEHVEHGPTETLGQGIDSHGAISNAPPNLYAKIRSRILNHQNYPRQARENGLEGRVQFIFSIEPSGNISELKIIKSSGHKILDEAALKTVRSAAPLPFIPEALSFSLVYTLKKSR